MKTVYNSNSDLIHLFAQRTQNEARTRSGNVFFEGNTLYSYGTHFFLAEFLSEDTVLINDTSYSNSTSKHQAITRSALRQYNQIYLSTWDKNKVLSELQYLESKIKKARKPEIYLNEALRLINSYNESQKVHPFQSYFSDSDSEKLSGLIEFFEGLTLNDEFIAKIKERQKKERQRKEKYFKQFTKAFFSYKPYLKLKTLSNSRFDLIRLSECGKYIETSQQVKVDKLEAFSLYSQLIKGENIHGKYIDGFSIDCVSPEMVKIGCHNLRLKDIKKAFQSIQ